MNANQSIFMLGRCDMFVSSRGKYSPPLVLAVLCFTVTQGHHSWYLLHNVLGSSQLMNGTLCPRTMLINECHITQNRSETLSTTWILMFIIRNVACKLLKEDESVYLLTGRRTIQGWEATTCQSILVFSKCHIDLHVRCRECVLLLSSWQREYHLSFSHLFLYSEAERVWPARRQRIIMLL